MISFGDFFSSSGGLFYLVTYAVPCLVLYFICKRACHQWFQGPTISQELANQIKAVCTNKHAVAIDVCIITTLIPSDLVST